MKYMKTEFISKDKMQELINSAKIAVNDLINFLHSSNDYDFTLEVIKKVHALHKRSFEVAIPQMLTILTLKYGIVDLVFAFEIVVKGVRSNYKNLKESSIDLHEDLMNLHLVYPIYAKFFNFLSDPSKEYPIASFYGLSQKEIYEVLQAIYFTENQILVEDIFDKFISTKDDEHMKFILAILPIYYIRFQNHKLGKYIAKIFELNNLEIRGVIKELKGFFKEFEIIEPKSGKWCQKNLKLLEARALN